LPKEELHNSYSSPNFIKIIKEDVMGRICSTNLIDEASIYGFGRKILKERDNLEDLYVDWKIVQMI
jgi:nitrogenase molybdenum-iron protein alpha/beta subunit